MKRRKALAAIGGITSLSGCSQLRGAVRTGPPYFEKVRIKAPNKVSAGGGVELEIFAKNTGGREGDFTATLTIGDGPLSIDQSVVIKNIPVGETKSTRVGPFTLPYTREYTFRITDYNARHKVSAEVLSLNIGGSASMSGSTLSAKNPSVVESVVRRSRQGLELLYPEGVFLAIDIETEVASDENKPNKDRFSVTGAEQTDVELYRRDPDRLPYEDVASDGTGYLVFEVLRGQLDDGVQLKYRANSDEKPEIVWKTDAIPTPNTTVLSVNVPDSSPLNADFEIKAVVANEGSRKGRFNAILEVGEESYTGSTDWNAVGRLTEAIEAGQEVELSHPAGASKITEKEYRLRTAEGLKNLGSVSITPAELKFGETYSFGGFWEVTLLSTEPVLADSITFGSGYSEDTYNADQGFGYLLIKASRTNAGGGGNIPRYESFSVPHNGDEYEPLDLILNTELTRPVSGTIYGGYQKEGTTKVGWIPIEVPNSVNPRSVQVKCAPEDINGEVENAVVWSN